MNIRDARPSDIEALIALDELAGGDPGRAEFIRHAITAHTCLVAEACDRLLGYGVLEHTFFSNGFISMVYVSRSERRQGLGAALLQALGARCRTPKLFTSTNASNHGMQALLVRSGFIPSGVIDHLDPGDPEWVYFRPR